MSTANTFQKSDRQRAGLRGNVKTLTDEFSMTEFGEDGRILFWRGNIVGGSKSERRYSYDSAGRIVSIEGSSGDDTDHFQYDQQGKKVRIRTVPPTTRATAGCHFREHNFRNDNGRGSSD